MEEAILQEVDSEVIARRCVAVCEDRKATNVMLFDVRGQSILADFYLICSGASEPQLRAIKNRLQQVLEEEEGLRPLRVEGKSTSHWLVMDYGVVLVHILDPELRGYYRMEDFWSMDNLVYRGEEDD